VLRPPAESVRLRDTFTVLVRHLLRRVRRIDFRAFVHPPAAIVAAAQAQGCQSATSIAGCVEHFGPEADGSASSA
jgi:hypothetical protein